MLGQNRGPVCPGVSKKQPLRLRGSPLAQRLPAGLQRVWDTAMPGRADGVSEPWAETEGAASARRAQSDSYKTGPNSAPSSAAGRRRPCGRGPRGVRAFHSRPCTVLTRSRLRCPTPRARLPSTRDSVSSLHLPGPTRALRSSGPGHTAKRPLASLVCEALAPSTHRNYDRNLLLFS